MRYLILVVLLVGSSAADCAASSGSVATGGRTVAEAGSTGPAAILPGEKKKCPMPGGYYFTYRFSVKPQLGTVILKVQVFGPDGRQVAPFTILGSYGMPEMRGAHDSGNQEFKKNRKGDYLLPMNIVMPGEWQLDLTFLKGKKDFYRGALKFNV